jgi:hypothetical protein
MRDLQNPAHDFIMGVGPIPTLAQPPAIDDITDQVERLTFSGLQEIEQQFRIAALCTEVNVRNPNRTKPSLRPKTFWLWICYPVWRASCWKNGKIFGYGFNILQHRFISPSDLSVFDRGRILRSRRNMGTIQRRFDVGFIARLN